MLFRPRRLPHAAEHRRRARPPAAAARLHGRLALSRDRSGRETVFACLATFTVQNSEVENTLYVMVWYESFPRVLQLVARQGSGPEVAILNNCPPLDIPRFWESFRAQLLESTDTVVAVNNPILAEQIFYQTGFRPPTVPAQAALLLLRV